MPDHRRQDTTLALLACLYAAVVIPLAIHKGGDFTIELGQSERLLHGLPPFGAADPNLGVPWPPFSAALLIPFALIARISLPLAKGLWAAISVVCVWWCVRWALQRAGSWRPAVIALAAVAVPLQTNFEHLNIAAVLLALVLLATSDLDAGRDSRAGVAIGIAAALKAFPALLLLYFAVQRRWRALAAGVGVALALTLLSLVPLGLPGAINGVQDWLLLGLGHRWVVQPAADQSLEALLARFGAPTSIAIAIGAALVVVTLVLIQRGARPDALLGMGACALLAVVLSPIAWVHSFVLLFPAWLGVLLSTSLTPTSRVALIVAGLGTSGFLTVGPRALRPLLLLHGAYTWSALLLWLVVVWCLRARPAAPVPVRA